MKKLAIATAIATLSIAATAANAYQVELNGGYNYTKDDGNSSLKNHDANVSGTYYFNPVSTNNGPLAEAAFLNRASNVGIGYDYNRTRFDTKRVNDLDKNSVNIGGEWYIPNSNFYASAGAGWSQYKYHNAYTTNANTYSAELGYLPTPGLLLAAGVAGVDGKHISTTDPTVRAKYVKQLDGGTALNLEAKARFNKDSNDYAAGIDYYLDKTLSIGTDYQRTTFDNHISPTNNVGFSARKFFTENVSADARVGFGDNTTSFGVGGTYRF